MNRRDFAAAAGFGLLATATRAVAAPLDAFSLPRWLELGERESATWPIDAAIEHWRVAENNSWRWYECSEWREGAWRIAGMTTPVHRESGESKEDVEGYFDVSVVPAELVAAEPHQMSDFCLVREGTAPGPAATDARRTREGRPPSRWLRNLSTRELRIWLTALDPPEAGVAGMTFFEHLTRDHGLDANRVFALTDAELAKLHGAVHHGY